MFIILAYDIRVERVGKVHKAVKKNCIHCKQCVKLCPTNNIIEEAGKIKFKSNNNCIYCLACIQWCPMQAINFGNYNLSPVGNYYVQFESTRYSTGTVAAATLKNIYVTVYYH